MKKSKIGLLLIALCLSATLYAQSNYVPGYVITNNNDSISGLIDFKTDKQNGQYCRFKLSETAPEQIFYPGDILRYRFINEGKYYVSHEITIDSIPRRIFLEYLVNGTMNLYYYKDFETSKEYYFFEDDSGKITGIGKDPDEIVNTVLYSDDKYIRDLGRLFIAYPTIRKRIYATKTTPMPFEKKNMIELVTEYHRETCTPGQECIVFINDYKKNFVEVELSVYAGFQFVNFSVKKIKGNSDIPNSMSSLSPVVGGQLFIYNPRWSRSLGFLVDAGISGFNASSNRFVTKGIPTYYEFNISALMLQSKLDAKYVYPKGKIRLVMEAGFSGFRLFNASNQLRIREEIYHDVINRNIKNYENIPNPTLMGVNCGIGVDYPVNKGKFVFCRLSYDNANSVTWKDKDYAFSNRIQTGQFKIGYTF